MTTLSEKTLSETTLSGTTSPGPLGSVPRPTIEHVGSCEALEAGLDALYVGAGVDLYCLLTARDDSEIDTYLGALGPSPARVVDVGAGAGRLTLPLLRAGHRVTGLDLSSAMLDRLSTAVTQEALTGGARLVHGSMLEYVEPAAHSHVLLGTANYSLLTDPAERAHFLGLTRANLAAGGAILAGFLDTDPEARPAGNMRVGAGLWMHETLDPTAGTRTITLRRGRTAVQSTTALLRLASVVAELEAAGFATPTVLSRRRLDAGREHVIVSASVATRAGGRP